MTSLHKPVVRQAIKPLDGSFGADSDRRLVVVLLPGSDTLPDTIELRPAGTRRPERLALVDVYRFALRSRVNRELLERAREVKARKADRLAQARQARAEKRLFQGASKLQHTSKPPVKTA